jgi:hypothetical protein
MAKISMENFEGPQFSDSDSVHEASYKCARRGETPGCSGTVDVEGGVCPNH